MVFLLGCHCRTGSLAPFHKLLIVWKAIISWKSPPNTVPHLIVLQLALTSEQATVLSENSTMIILIIFFFLSLSMQSYCHWVVDPRLCGIESGLTGSLINKLIRYLVNWTCTCIADCKLLPYVAHTVAGKGLCVARLLIKVPCVYLNAILTANLRCQIPMFSVYP